MMFRSLLALLIATVVSGFSLNMMAAAKKPTAPKVVVVEKLKSQALPFTSVRNNEYMTESIAGYAGFDPFGFTDSVAPVLAGSPTNFGTFKWFREAEITHGRVAQLAVVGNLFPAYYHFPGNKDFGVADDAFAQLNPFTALETVPHSAIGQIVLTAAIIESIRVQRVIFEGRPAGDLGLGQFGWNPFNLQYTEEEYFEKQVQEIKHGRLAMFGAIGMLLQAKVSGLGVAEQLAAAFSLPEYRDVLSGNGVLGDFFPPNI